MGKVFSHPTYRTKVREGKDRGCSVSAFPTVDNSVNKLKSRELRVFLWHMHAVPKVTRINDSVKKGHKA